MKKFSSLLCTKFRQSFYKAGLVVKGFEQKQGDDYDIIFSPFVQKVLYLHGDLEK